LKKGISYNFAAAVTFLSSEDFYETMELKNFLIHIFHNDVITIYKFLTFFLLKKKKKVFLGNEDRATNP